MPLSSHRDFEAALTFAASSTEHTMDRLLPKAATATKRASSRRCAIRAWAAASACARFSCWPAQRCSRSRALPALRTASAIEFLHAYSLIHDDLPAMDDDDLRRGKPSCHKQFDEATAILAGDALQALAFEVLAHEDTHGDASVRAHLVSDLARAAGAHGMVGGQMLDLLAETRPDLSIGAITRLQRLKTGALISFSCTAGAILGKASDPMRARPVGLCPRCWPGLPDRRRPARHRGQRGRARQDAGQGRGGGQGDLRVDPGPRAGAGPGRPAGATGRRASGTVRRGRGFAKAGGEIRCRAAGLRGRAGV